MVILVVCIVNYLNLSTISAIEERKSYSIRILNGSSKLSVFTSLLLKNLFLYGLALLISVANCRSYYSLTVATANNFRPHSPGHVFNRRTGCTHFHSNSLPPGFQYACLFIAERSASSSEPALVQAGKHWW